MVQLVSLVAFGTTAGTLTIAGVTVISGGALTLAGIGLNVAASLLLSSALRPDVPEPPRPDNVQVTTKAAVAPRVIHYGYVKAGGNIVFHRAKDGVSYRIICHGHGEISEVVQRYLNAEPVTLNGTGHVQEAQYQLDGPRVQILDRFGQVPETHYGEVTAIWPAWTEDHRLDDQWTSLIICQSVAAEHYREMYPNNEPELTVVAKGRQVFDPRTGEQAFSDNLALCIADYLSSPDGFNRPELMEEADLIAEANICDIATPLVAGGFEPKYRLGGSIALNEAPQDGLRRMLDAGAAELRLKPNGKARLRVGYWRSPTVTITFDQLIEVEEVTPGPDVLERYNTVPARFTSQDLGYTEVDAEIWEDATRVSEDGGTLLGEALELIMCPSHRQARQVQQIRTELDNPRIVLSLVCKPSALDALFEDVVTLDLPELDLSGSFRVRGARPVFEGGHLSAVALRLALVSPDAFSQSLEDQGNVQQAPDPDTPAGVPQPQELAAVGAGVQTSANTFVAGLSVAWQAPPSDALTPRVQYKAPWGLFSNWLDVPVAAGATGVQISGLQDGVTFDVRVAFVSPGGVVGPYAMETGVVATAAADAPDPPSDLSVSDQGGGQALVSFTAAASASIYRTEIYRDAVLVANPICDPGEDITFVDPCGAGTFDWTARSINVSGIASATDTGPVTETIT